MPFFAPKIRPAKSNTANTNTSLTNPHEEENSTNASAKENGFARSNTTSPPMMPLAGNTTPSMARSFSNNFAIQAKLNVGPTDDKYEQEADEIADRVVQGKGMPEDNNIGTTSETPTIQRTPTPVELVPATPEQSEALRSQGIQLPSVSGSTWRAIGGSPYTSLFPGYSQEGDTCGAASLVSALIIWDREHWDPAIPNERLVNACNLILIAFERHGNAAIRRWARHPAPVVRRACNGDSACHTRIYSQVKDRFIASLQRIRDAARQRGAGVSEADYREVAFGLYFIWHEGGQSGLDSGDIRQVQQTLGLDVQASAAAGNIQSFDDIFTNPIIQRLQPDRFAQVTWIVTAGQHAFLMGRLQSGEWFLSDQGPRPAAEFRANTLIELRDAVRVAADSGRYWIYTGSHTELMNRGGLIPGWTGVLPIGDHNSINNEAQNLVASGTHLGEVDEGAFTNGSVLNSIGFVSQKYSLPDAQAELSSSSRTSGLVIEMPTGVFQLYSVSAVSSANLSQVVLDSSGGGLLLRRTFQHAWLNLGTASGRHGSWFSVY